MHLGAFSISLAVKDLAASRAFYATLGFVDADMECGPNYAILKNGDTVIGLFQGMFEDNLLTFNPGWSQAAEPLEDFEDVRSLQAKLEAAGITPVMKADPEGAGPAHFVVVDPDGNTILVDQHVPKPG